MNHKAFWNVTTLKNILSLNVWWYMNTPSDTIQMWHSRKPSETTSRLVNVVHDGRDSQHRLFVTQAG